MLRVLINYIRQAFIDRKLRRIYREIGDIKRNFEMDHARIEYIANLGKIDPTFVSPAMAEEAERISKVVDAATVEMVALGDKAFELLKKRSTL